MQHVDREANKLVKIINPTKLVNDSVLKKIPPIQQIIQDIWHLNSSTAYVCCQNVFREANFKADKVVISFFRIKKQVDEYCLNQLIVQQILIKIIC